jgi:hypothetical protein
MVERATDKIKDSGPTCGRQSGLNTYEFHPVISNPTLRVKVSICNTGR